MAYEGKSPISVSAGGTGKSSFTAYSVICGGTSGNNPLQNVVGVGTIGQILVSTGGSSLPTWQTPATGLLSSLTGDTGGAISGTTASLYNVNLLGSPGVHVNGNAGTNTLTVTVDGITPLTITADTGTATESAGSLTILGASSSTANVFGGISTSASGSTVNIQLTNRVTASTTTTGITPSAVTLMALGATPAGFAYNINVTGFDAGSAVSCSIEVSGSVRTDGATATVAGTPSQLFTGDAGLIGAVATLVASANNAQLQITGVVAETISWKAVGYYAIAS